MPSFSLFLHPFEGARFLAPTASVPSDKCSESDELIAACEDRTKTVLGLWLDGGERKRRREEEKRKGGKRRIE
jgi:hypothetical protein